MAQRWFSSEYNNLSTHFRSDYRKHENNNNIYNIYLLAQYEVPTHQLIQQRLRSVDDPGR